MTISHHPSDETLLRLAAGTLDAGPALVVSVHLEGCAFCRDHLSRLEAVGGAIVDAMPPAPLAVDLFGRTVERLVAGSAMPAPVPVVRNRPFLGIELPNAMRHCEIGPWRWLGPRFRRSRVRIAGSPNANVMLLKGKPGLHLPAHGHTGMEFTQVLCGSLADERGTYLPGDLDEADDGVDHLPIVEGDTDCICLAALEGHTRLHGVIGRLLGPFAGF